MLSTTITTTVIYVLLPCRPAASVFYNALMQREHSNECLKLRVTPTVSGQRWCYIALVHQKKKLVAPCPPIYAQGVSRGSAVPARERGHPGNGHVLPEDLRGTGTNAAVYTDRKLLAFTCLENPPHRKRWKGKKNARKNRLIRKFVKKFFDKNGPSNRLPDRIRFFVACDNRSYQN